MIPGTDIDSQFNKHITSSSKRYHSTSTQYRVQYSTVQQYSNITSHQRKHGTKTSATRKACQRREASVQQGTKNVVGHSGES